MFLSAKRTIERHDDEDEAPVQERLEAWIMKEVNAGAALPGLYPSNVENKAWYETEMGKK
jgi:hypothetical protein